VANALDWRRASRTIEALTVTGGTTATLTGGAEPEVVTIMLAGRHFFEVFGESFVLGRPFAPADYESVANAAFGPIATGKTEGAGTVILSEKLWRRRFGADFQIAGRSILLNGRPATVVGVLRGDFQFDDTIAGTADCWIPLAETRMSAFRRFRQFAAVGRLAPGVTLGTAQAEMDGLATSLAARFPADNAGWRIRVAPLHESVVGDSRRVLWVLLAGAGCVLLIGCASLAGLLLMRAARRAREFTVRAALGAGGGRLVRQWLAESIVLSLLGGSAGFLAARAAVPALVAYAPPDFPRLREVTVDSRIFVFSVLLSLATGVACSLASAAIQRRAGTAAASLRGAAVSLPGPRLRWLRQSLVVSQVMLAMVLLVGAGLMLRTVVAVQSLDLGFSPRNVLTFSVTVRGEQYRTLAAMREFSRELVKRLEGIEGVEAAAVGAMPLADLVGNTFEVEGGADPGEVVMNVPSAGYFSALGIRLLHGRHFIEDDGPGMSPVAIVSRQFAVRAWGRADVVNQRLRPAQSNGPWITVVGVVPDLRVSNLEAEAPPVVFLPSSQTNIAFYTSYVVRTAVPPERLVPFVRRAVADLDPSLALTKVSTVDERVSEAVAPRTFNMWLMGVYSVVALALALLGVYGLLSEAVTGRVAEIGVRMALGARRHQVMSLVLRQGMLLTVSGLVIGLTVAVALTRFLSGLLFGVRPLDVPTFAGAALLFAAIASVASYVPARRASRLDPVVALRIE